jgi:hypothetical protein
MRSGTAVPIFRYALLGWVRNDETVMVRGIRANEGMRTQGKSKLETIT